jgi:hypothetical protein
LNIIVYQSHIKTAGLDVISRLSPSDKEYQTTVIKPWQSTKVYGDLTMRYWNDVKIPKLEKSNNEKM